MKISSVIISYNPNKFALYDLILSVNKQNVDVILVDNASVNKSEINDLKSDSRISFSLIELENNCGIAKAQNVGIEYALEMGAKKIIFFDQDSTINKDFIDNLINDFNSLKKSGINLAAIGPQFIDKELGFYAPGLLVKKNGLIDKIDISKISKPEEVGIIISSGSLISVPVLKDIGFMNEDFFIDYVDTEWCFRALAKGYKVYVSSNAIMYHSVGESTIQFFGKTCPVHSAYRRYYRIRNLLLMRNMPHISKAWIISMLINNFIAQLALIFTQKNKIAYIRYFLISIIDGFKGKKGSL